jgi:hypothetical protein
MNYMTDILADKMQYFRRDLFHLTGRYKYLTGYQGPHSWVFFVLERQYMFSKLYKFLIGS